MAPPAWCYERDYAKEHLELEKKCELIPVQDNGHPLALLSKPRETSSSSRDRNVNGNNESELYHETAQGQGRGHADLEPEPRSNKKDAEGSEGAKVARGRSVSQLVLLADDDFDPLAAPGGVASETESKSEFGERDGHRHRLEDGQGFRNTTEPSPSTKSSATDHDIDPKFGDPSKTYTPGMERRESWQDWRDRRNQLLNIKSFLDKTHLAKDESFSVVTVNLNFQVVGSTSLTSASASSDQQQGGNQAALSRLQELEDIIEQKNRDRRQTVASSAAMRQQILSDQQEMVERLRLLSNDLSAAWAKNQRVVAVKIAEKTADLLEKQAQQIHVGAENVSSSGSMQTNGMQDGVMITSLVFYPAIFVFACEILDTLGDLVWERIRRKCQYEDDGTFVRTLGMAFTHEQVREEAKYTCNNWFLKIGGNKSLLGRIYLEASLSRSHHFLIGSTHQEEMHDRVFVRLAKMCRGVSHPVTSSFARMYVARRGHSLLPESCSFTFMDILLADVVKTFKKLAMSKVNHSARGLHLLKLINVCLKYIVETHGKALMAKSTSTEAKSSKLKQVLRLITTSNNSEGSTQMHPCSLCILQHFLKHLPKQFVMEYAIQLTQLVGTDLEAQNQSQTKADPLLEYYTQSQAECFAHIGSYLSADAAKNSRLNASTLKKDQQRQLLNLTWRVVLKYSNLDQFLKVALAFADFITTSFREREVNVYVQSIYKHIHVHVFKSDANEAEKRARRESVTKRDQARKTLTETHVNHVKDILLHLFRYYKDFVGDLSPLFGFPSLVPLTDISFQSNSQKVEFAETLIHLLFSPSQNSRDLAVADPIAQQFCLDMCQLVSDSISSEIHSVSSRRVKQVGGDISRFILSCEFGGNYESHLTFLSTCRRNFNKVVEVQEICVHLACKIATSNNCGGDMANACIAFCHITIPSLPDSVRARRLMLQAANVALMNGLVSQAESLIIESMADTCDIEFLKSVCAFILMLPGHPQKGPLFVCQELVEAFKRVKAKGPDLIQLLPLLAAFSQPEYLYFVKGVDSNCELYSGDPSFQKELEELAASIIVEALENVDASDGAAKKVLLETIRSTIKPSQALSRKLDSL